MGHAVVVEPNEKFYPPVHEAEQAARAAGAGLHDAEVDCTLPGQVAALEDDTENTVVASAGLATGVGLEEVDRHRTRLATAATTGGALLALLDGDRTSGPTSRYDEDVLVDLRERTARQHERVTAAQVTTDALRATEEQRIEAERVAAEEEARRVAEEAARQADEARRAEEAREADAARQAARAASAASAPASGGSGGSAASGGSGGSGGGSVFYQNCDAVRAAGAAPLLVGQPGYARKLDRDGDGVACE
ncbi:excalibur calcium-binding domain-containing protein [Cellulomonas sp. Sa3CUA2]|uniref:Excalibur calcium-binding domain-containing protein n=2 Tax=Cellulomonas avistercoris TaxID=2762242 RepID=A0ABR8Q9R4_9CELL|nr:excalibur calcium-binding domain-containing protein [Cellulomonas avistercoris]